MRKAVIAASLLLACSIVVSAGWAQCHPADRSEQLVTRLFDAEKRMAPERLAGLCLFDGIVRMDSTDPAHHHKH